MRRTLSVATLALVFVPVFALAAEFPLNEKNTTIKFTGSKPGKNHEGGFKSVSGKASVDGKDITTLKINVEIQTDSLYADDPKLTNHLKSPDFFGVKTNPTAKFASTKVEKSGSEYKITGDLTMLGKTKSITFPATISAADGAFTLSASFTIDRTQWGMTYGPGKVDNNVKLTVNVNTK